MARANLPRRANGQLVRAWIPFAVKRRVCAKPCAVCGIPFGIKCDHIVAVAAGGSSDEANLQPLCHGCNHMKHATRTNGEVAEMVRKIGLEHFQRACYLEATRHWNSFEKPSLHGWIGSNPQMESLAHELFAKFSEA